MRKCATCDDRDRCPQRLASDTSRAMAREVIAENVALRREIAGLWMAPAAQTWEMAR